MTDRIAAVGDRVCVVETGPLDGAEGVLVELGPYAHEVLLDRDGLCEWNDARNGREVIAALQDFATGKETAAACGVEET